MAHTALGRPGLDLSAAFCLADDVLVYTFEFLSLPQLRSAAGVSRTFYGAAWRSGLYIHRKITDVTEIWDECITVEDPHMLGRRIIAWNQLLDHALDKHLRVSLTVDLETYGGVLLRQRTEHISMLDELLYSITRSLPILVSLSITIGDFAYQDLFDALQDPAPCLRSLFLRSPRHRKPLDPTVFKLPSGLFSGSAPHLRELGLDYSFLGPDTLPVFSKVVRFSTQDCDLGVRVPLARHFPQLAHLLVADDDPEESQIPPQHVDISGVNLRSFVFHDTTAREDTPVERTLGLSLPSAFHYIVEDGKRNGLGNLSLGWRDSRDGLLALHIPETRCWFSIRVMSLAPDETWRRSYTLREYAGLRVISEAPDVAKKLAYIRIPCWQVSRIVECDTQLIALRRLRVDIIWGPSYGAKKKILEHVRLEYLEDESYRPCRLRCPALETVALLWMCDAPEEHVSLDTVDIFILGRTLGTGDTKPVLELGDIERDRPLMLPDKSESPDAGSAVTVADVFSVVCQVPCARGVLLDRFDGDEWNDHAALEADNYLKQSLAW